MARAGAGRMVLAVAALFLAGAGLAGCATDASHALNTTRRSPSPSQSGLSPRALPVRAAVPRGEAAMPWRLISQQGAAVTILLSKHGCTVPTGVALTSSASSVTVTAYGEPDRTPKLPCTANEIVFLDTVHLPAPLGHRRLLHGTRPAG